VNFNFKDSEAYRIDGLSIRKRVNVLRRFGVLSGKFGCKLDQGVPRTGPWPTGWSCTGLQVHVMYTWRRHDINLSLLSIL